MTSLTRRLLRVHAGETRLVLVMGFLLLINSLALQVSDIVAVSGFLSEVGVEEILIVWIIDMLLIAAAASAQSLIVDRFNRVRLLRGMIVGFAFIYIALRLMFTFQLPAAFNYSLLFLLAEQQWLFFPLIFWILANDIFDLQQAKRLFPLMASMGFIGQIIGFAVAAAAPELLRRYNITSAELLNLNVLIYLVAYFMSGVLANVRIRQTHQKKETVRETLTEGIGFVREVPSFRYLMLAMLMAAAAITVYEYHFLVVSTRAFTEPGSFQTFYGLTRLLETVLAIVLQTFITSRIIDRSGLKNTFLVMPIVTVISAALMIGVPGVFSATGAWLASKLSLNTVDQSARKTLQALVPEERRGRVSMFIDSYLFAAGVILGAVITGIVLIVASLAGAAPAPAYLAISLALAVLAVVAIIKMRNVYDSSLFNWRLKRRQRSASALQKLEF